MREQNMKKTQNGHVRPSGLKNFFYAFAGTIFAIGSLLILAWMTVYIHPDSEIAATQSSAQMRTNVVSQLNSYSNAAKLAVLGEMKAVLHSNKIPESATVAPPPDYSCFGETTSPAEILQVIEQAREFQLLSEEETVVFSASMETYRETPIRYYCDKTLLALCWTEKIDGRVCTCAEIKIADASQFRRKLTEDTYGSSVRSYATELASQVNAVVAMNADLYAQRDLGVTVYNRQVYRFNEWPYTGKYSQYNAVDHLFVDGSGNFHFMKKGTDTTREAVQRIVDENDILFSIAFGPILVENGELQTCDWYPCGEVFDEYSRAGIAQVDERHYFYMTVSHSPSGTPRCNINQFAQMMYDKGVRQAYALDGGQTGEIVFDGKICNFIDFGAERTVSDIIYFASAVNSSGVKQK